MVRVESESVALYPIALIFTTQNVVQICAVEITFAEKAGSERLAILLRTSLIRTLRRGQSSQPAFHPQRSGGREGKVPVVL